MLNTKYTRTTISLPEDLMFRIKKKALIENRKLKDIISEGLDVFLSLKSTKQINGNLYLKESIVDRLYGILGKGESGVSFVKRIRNTKADKRRDAYLRKLWKKSS